MRLYDAFDEVMSSVNTDLIAWALEEAKKWDKDECREDPYLRGIAAGSSFVGPSWRQQCIIFFAVDADYAEAKNLRMVANAVAARYLREAIDLRFEGDRS